MPDFAFRPVTRADLPMLGDWLRQPAVGAWWVDADKQLAGIEEDLSDPAMQQIMVLQGDKVLAYAQVYEAHHWNAPHFSDTPAGTLAIDVFSGPEGFGLGGDWLRALADDLLTQAPVLVIDPDPANQRAIRAYAKAGFSGDLIGSDENGHPARIMTRYR